MVISNVSVVVLLLLPPHTPFYLRPVTPPLHPLLPSQVENPKGISNCCLIEPGLIRCTKMLFAAHRDSLRRALARAYHECG
ncbi:hypothetical protein F4777DRAFT_532181 [Nemania sp. FL0916]|nr:hypothetical protein F4777DRAFT_532181 [Nemania sp. FL0916]